MKVRFKVAAIVAAASVGAFVPLSGALPGPTGAPAKAAETSCGMTMPSTVRVAAEHTKFNLQLTKYCLDAHVVKAYWVGYMGITPQLVDSTGTEYGGSSDHTFPRWVWDVDNYYQKLGTETWWPDDNFWSHAQDANGNFISQRKFTTTFKVGESASLSSSRSGSYVTLKTYSAYFSQYYAKFVPWRHVTGMIQYYGAHGWTNLKYAYQDANGHYTYKVHSTAKRSYRLTLPTTSTAWGTASASSYR
jgi:hypothetical protein